MCHHHLGGFLFFYNHLVRRREGSKSLHKDKCKFHRADIQTAYLLWYSQFAQKRKFLKPKPLCVCKAKDSVNENENELFSRVLDRARFERIRIGRTNKIHIRLNILIQLADYETKAVQRPLQKKNKNHGFFFLLSLIRSCACFERSI